MQKLVIKPTIAMKVQKIEARMKLRSVTWMRKEAKNVPKIIAKNVNEVFNPFAREILSVETSSGTIPYLEGPKRALCVASKNNMT